MKELRMFAAVACGGAATGDGKVAWARLEKLATVLRQQ